MVLANVGPIQELLNYISTFVMSELTDKMQICTVPVNGTYFQQFKYQVHNNIVYIEVTVVYIL